MTSEGICRRLNYNIGDVTVLQAVDSTCNRIKELAALGAPEMSVVIAETQTAGRGRMGRSFFSPPKAGLYMSVLLRPQLKPADTLCITPMAAVCVADAIEACAALDNVNIKWVNDILISDKKVCGILTESTVSAQTGLADYVTIGIGVNVVRPSDGVPRDLDDIITYIYNYNNQYDLIAAQGDDVDEIKMSLAADILNRLYSCVSGGLIGSKVIYDSYKARLNCLGRRAQILSHNASDEKLYADIVDLNDDFSLSVRYDDGTLHALSSGEISIR